MDKSNKLQKSPFHFRNLKSPDAQYRECLRCGKKFLSESKFNRICPSCQQSNKSVAVYPYGLIETNRRK